jgi:hypothetical protein
MDCCVMGVFLKVIWHFVGVQSGGDGDGGVDGEDEVASAAGGTDVKIKASLQGAWWKVALMQPALQKEIAAKLVKLQVLAEQEGSGLH